MALTEPQQQLADTMSEISEFCWFAGWLIGTEYRLWRFMTDPSDDEPWGNYPIPAEYRQRLQQLSDVAGGWIYWNDEPSEHPAGHGAKFVPIENWLNMFEDWQQRHRLARQLPRRYADYPAWFARQAEGKEPGES